MLRTHLAVEVADVDGLQPTVRTACNKRGFKNSGRSNAVGEWESQHVLGGLIAFGARRFDAFMAGPLARHNACARCRAAWMDGAEGADADL